MSDNRIICTSHEVSLESLSEPLFETLELSSKSKHAAILEHALTSQGD